PKKIHGVVTSNVGYFLGHYIRQQRKGYITTNDAGTLLERDPDTIRGPGVAYFTDARAFRELHPAYGEVPPVLAVDVLSPGARLRRRRGRRRRDQLPPGLQTLRRSESEPAAAAVDPAAAGRGRRVRRVAVSTDHRPRLPTRPPRHPVPRGTPPAGRPVPVQS